jgi:hypothetical protein
MSKGDSKDPGLLTFYPAYCYPVSPTYFAWVKLTAEDINQHLRSRHGLRQLTSDGNPLYFYLNHPIQFVQVVGVVVAIEDYHSHIFLITLDDSSGSTLDVVWRKPKPDLENSNDSANGRHGRPQNAATTASKSTSAKVSTSGAVSKVTLAEGDDLGQLLSTLQIGTIVLAKGTLSTFRNTLQLSLLRLSLLTPQLELRFIQSRSSLLLTTLCKPWKLSSSVQKRLLAEATGEKEQESERAARARRRAVLREQREKKDGEEIMRRWNEEEKVREQEAEQARLAGLEVANAIKGDRMTTDVPTTSVQVVE